jgi:DNA primase
MDASTISDFILAAGLADNFTLTTRREHLKFCCPFAPWSHQGGDDKHPSFTITAGKEPSFLCFSCHRKGLVWQMFKLLGTLTGDIEYSQMGSEFLKVQHEDSLSEATILVDYDSLGVEEDPDMTALEAWFRGCYVVDAGVGSYVHDRGISARVAADYDLRWDDNKQRLMLPLYNLSGKFVGVTGRSLNDSVEPRWLSYWGTKKTRGLGRPIPWVLNHKKIQETWSKVILVEGQFDGMKTFQNLLDLGLEKEWLPLYICGSMLSKKQLADLESLQLPIYLLMDNDKPGREAAKGIRKKLAGKVPVVKTLECEGVNDPGEMTSRMLEQILKRGKRHGSS